MAEIKVGDRVRVKDHADRLSPQGYKLANAEGIVMKWVVEYDEVMEEFQDCIYVHIEKAEGEGQTYEGNNMFFLEENLEKI